MRALLFLFAFSACVAVPPQTEWTVTKIERYKSNDMWRITAISSRGSKKFITNCKPDTIGSKFMAAPKSIKN